jgi:N-dimethylarginine dimethylaminohydrolase
MPNPPAPLDVTFELDDPASERNISEAFVEALHSHGITVAFTRAATGWEGRVFNNETGELANDTVFTSDEPGQTDAEDEIYQRILGQFAADFLALWDSPSHDIH